MCMSTPSVPESKPLPPQVKRDTVEDSNSNSRTAQRRQTERSFNRQSTILTGNDETGSSDKKKTLLGQ